MSEIKIGVVSTYPELSRQIMALAAERQLQVELREGVLQEGVRQARQLERQGVDVIISRGPTGRMIKKAVSLPVALIDITSFDILQALHAAGKLGRRIAYLGHRVHDFTPDFASITEILAVDVQCYPYSNEYEMNCQVARILDEGATEVVVSTGQCILEMSRRSGLKAVLVQSGYETVYSSLERARELALSVQQEQRRWERFRSVLELTSDGILVLNENRQVSFLNPAGEKLLGVDAGSVLGRHVDELRQTVLGPLLQGGKVSDVLKTVGKKQFLVSSLPILLKDKEQGAVITFQSADRIQVLEHNLRRQLFKKGLVARYTFADIIGESPLLHQAVRQAKKFAAAKATVLICGESGTGKELFAQSIHNESSRSRGPFVAVNCAALPENLLESELFGYEEGAFTGAKKGGKVGLFEMAHGGTIFLDEIGELPLPVQARLLRVLQEREIMRLGSDRIIPVDVRVIAATNYNLAREVKAGRFRSDLYHRLEVLGLELPPLRARKEDIGLLARHFVRQLSLQEGKSVPQLNAPALDRLKRYDWPGNIRELQNVILKYVLLIEEGQDPAELVERLIGEKLQLRNQSAVTGAGETITLRIGRLEDMEREVIRYLKSTGRSSAEIARLLGTSRTTLWRKTRA